MKIIVEVRDTATLSRIDAFDKALKQMAVGHGAMDLLGHFADVIKSISKEW